jgi:hypothetical protein
VELDGVGELHAAFLNESRTRRCWWHPVEKIRIRGPKTTGEAHQTISLPNRWTGYPKKLLIAGGVIAVVYFVAIIFIAGPQYIGLVRRIFHL